MTCRHFQSLLEQYTDNELSQSEITALESHLKVCTSCRAEYEATLQLKQLLSVTPVPEVPSDYWRETRELILARTTEADDIHRIPVAPADQHDNQTSMFIRSLVSAAASIVIFFAALLIGSTHESQIVSTPIVGNQLLATPSVLAMMSADQHPMLTEMEQNHLAKGILILGPPGMLGRFRDLTTSSWTQ